MIRLLITEKMKWAHFSLLFQEQIKTLDIIYKTQIQEDSKRWREEVLVRDLKIQGMTSWLVPWVSFLSCIYLGLCVKQVCNPEMPIPRELFSLLAKDEKRDGLARQKPLGNNHLILAKCHWKNVGPHTISKAKRKA